MYNLNVEISILGNENVEEFKELILLFEEVFEMENFKM